MNLQEIIRLGAEDALRNANLIDPSTLRPDTAAKLKVEISSLNRALNASPHDLDELLDSLNKIGSLSTTELIAQKPQKTEALYNLSKLSSQTHQLIQSIVVHPDYKPPKRYP